MDFPRFRVSVIKAGIEVIGFLLLLTVLSPVFADTTSPSPVSIFLPGETGALPVSGRVDADPISVFFPDDSGSAPVSGRIDGNPINVYLPAATGVPAVSGRIDQQPLSVYLPDDDGVSPVSGRIDGNNVAVSIQPANILDPDLIGLWRMDGDWTDSSGNGHHGMDYNGPIFSTDRIAGGRGGKFDGTNDYVQVANTSVFRPPQMSVAAWVKPQAFNVYKTILTNEPVSSSSQFGFGLRQRTDNRFWFVIGKEGSGSASQSNTIIAPDTWYFLTGTFDGSKISLYVNGSLESSIDSNLVINTTSPLCIGRLNSNSEHFNGLIDEVAIYKRALTAEEIESLYNKAVLESQPPAQPIVIGSPAITSTANLTLRGTKEADTSIWISGQKKVDLSADLGWSAEVNLNSGANLLSLIARNEYGIDSNPVILQIILDNVAPAVVQRTPVDGALINTANQAVSFKLQDTYSPIDLGATTAAASMTHGGQPVNGAWTASGNDTVLFTSQAPLADGSYVATVRPTDALGNSVVANLSFTVDTTPPAVPGITPPAGAVSSTVTLNGTRSTDAASVLVTSTSGSVGAVSYPSATSWRVTISGLLEGETTVSASAQDAAGNRSDAASIVLAVDTTPPAAPTVGAIDSPTRATSVTLAGTKEAGSRLFVNNQEYADALAADSWSIPAGLQEGANTFEVYAKDAADNRSGSATLTVVRDTTAPAIASASPAVNAVVSGTGTISISLADIYSTVDLTASLAGALVKDGSGAAVPGSWAIVDGALIFTPAAAFLEGAYTVLLQPVDSLGNTGTAAFGFTLDASPPSVKTLAMSPDTPHRAETVVFTLTFSEAMNTPVQPTVTMVRERLLLDARTPLAGNWLNATTWRGQYAFTASTGDGQYEVTVSGGKDQAGNLMAEQTAGTFVLDTEAPAAPTLAPVTTPTKTATQLLTGTRPAGTAIVINGVQKVPAGAETAWSVSYPLKEGANSLAIAARDAAGNDSAAVTAAIALDTTPPLFTVDIFQGQSAQATQTLSGRKEPGCTVTLNGTTIFAASDLDETWSYPVTLEEGIATRLTFAAADPLGNVTTRTVDLLFDAAAPPALAERVLQADGSGRGTEVTLSWPAYVEPADLAYYRIYVSTTDFTDIVGLTAVGTANRGSKTFKAPVLTEGTTYFFAVEPVDTSGNSETAVHTASAVPIDAAPPEEVTGLTATASYGVAAGNSVTLRWTASKDSRGDLADQLLYIDAGAGYDAGTVLEKTAVTHTVSELADATLYKFRIATRDTAGHESAGVAVQAVTRLPNPAGLTAEPGKNQAILRWPAVVSPHLAHYKIYRQQATQTQSDAAAMTAVHALAGTSWTDTGLVNGVTYQYAVTVVNTSGAENTAVQSVAAAPRQDAVGPVIGTFNLAPNQVVAAPLTIEAAATDADTDDDREPDSDMQKLALFIDGVLVKEAVAPSQGAPSLSLNFYWNVVAAEDGNHEVKIVAVDALGNATEVVRTVVVSLAPPVTPVVVAHSTESTAPVYQVGASGTAPLYTTVTLKVNGVVTGETQTTATGAFSFAGLLLVEGENFLSAKAAHRGGDSPWSAPYRITVDTGAPPAPTGLAAKALAGGTVQFTWQAGTGEIPTGYNLYASSSPFASPTDAGVSRTNTTAIAYLFREIIPADDAVRYYAVTALDGAGNESVLSNLVEIAADRSLPQVSGMTFAAGEGTPAATLTTGPGIVSVAFAVSEPLKELPFFSLEPQVGSPIVLTLKKVDETHYSGTFRVDATTPHGPTTWKFSGKDLIGNRGSAQGAGPVLDVRGPVASIAAPLALQQIASAVAVEVAFDEDPVGTPVLEFRDLSGSAVPVTGLVQTGDLRHWQGTVDLSPLAEGEGSFRLVEAKDGFGNLGTTVAGGQKLLLYTDAPPAPAVPQNLVAKAEKGGKIALSWQAVSGATAYRLYRQGEGDSFVLIASPSAVTYSDLPEADGLYTYAVAAVGLLDSESAMGTEATAVFDRTPPSAPTGLALALAGSGVQATWQGVQVAGDPAVEVPASYKLYRASQPIAAVAGLSAVASAAVLEAVDAAPVASQRQYAVTALDALGNESAPSEGASIDFPVAPVQSLVLTQIEGGKPQLSWQAPQSGLQGYFIYRNGQKVNASPTPGTTYTDGYYAGGSVTYGISALDAYGNESPVREIVLPDLAIDVREGTVLRRGLLETVPVALRSSAASTLKEIRLKVGSGSESTLPGPFTLTAGSDLTVQKVAATPLDAASTVAVVGTAILEPAPGSRLEITRTSAAQVAGSGTALEVFNEPLVRGTNAQVRLKVNNLGSARMDFLTSENGGATSQVRVFLKDQDGNILAEGRLDQRTGSQVVNSAGYATARIEPGQSFLSEPITFQVPASAPYAVVLEAVIANTYYHYKLPEEVKAPGMRQSVAGTINEVSYRVSAQAEKDLYRRGDTVTISGHAVSTVTGGPMANVPVRLGISLKGFDRFYNISTDANGDFSFKFTPGSGEFGTFSLWATHPDIQGRTVQDTFDLIGLRVSQTLINLKLARGGFFDVPLRLENLGNVPLTGLTIQTSASTGLSANFMGGAQDTRDLAGGESRPLTLRIAAAENSPDTGFASVDIATAEGLTEKVIVNATVASTYPVIQASPSYIDTGLMRGTQRLASFTLKNVGLGNLNNARIEGPSTSWIALTQDRNLGSLAIGQSISVGLLFRPGETVPPGVYNDRLVIYSDNHIPFTFNIQVTVTSNAVGNVQFDVLNELYEDVAGASITIQHQSLPELTYTLKTGADGTASKFDIPEGRYSLMVTATGHKSYGGSFVVTPGLTITVPIALEVTLVEVEWSVTEITIEDRYEIKIEQTFETNVPTAVIVVEPPAMVVPKMAPGDVFNSEIRITNYGLVSAKFLGMDFPATIGADIDLEVLNTIPDNLGAMETVVVPYRLTRREQP